MRKLYAAAAVAAVCLAVAGCSKPSDTSSTTETSVDVTSTTPMDNGTAMSDMSGGTMSSSTTTTTTSSSM